MSRQACRRAVRSSFGVILKTLLVVASTTAALHARGKHPASHLLERQAVGHFHAGQHTPYGLFLGCDGADACMSMKTCDEQR